MTAGKSRNFTAREIAYPALMCALLIGGQYVFSFVAGVEIVTVLLVSFSAVFGVRQGVLCAAAFSLLRCLVFGFYPSVVILYVIYYPLLACAFGLLGHIKTERFGRSAVFAATVNVLLLGIACAALSMNLLNVIKVSRLMKGTITALLWAVFALGCALLAAFDTLLIVQKLRKKEVAAAVRLFTFTSIAAVCTVCFTLLDDVITPLFFGYTKTAALAYFYTSFTAMLPQTVCTLVTVGFLFLPVTAVFGSVKKRRGSP